MEQQITTIKVSSSDKQQRNGSIKTNARLPIKRLRSSAIDNEPIQNVNTTKWKKEQHQCAHRIKNH